MAVTKYQKFEAVTINRGEIKNAPYNPRTISEDARKKLRANIKKVGLLDTLVVNKDSMNLVSGHQRLSILDSLERKEDYELTVAMVCLTGKEEKEQNIFFNNSKTQGQYDLGLLSSMFEDIDYTAAGFELNDLAIIGVDTDLLAIDNNVQESIAEKEAISSNNEIYENAREMRKALIKGSQDNNKQEYDTCVVLTFSNNKNKAAFMDRFDFRAQDKYIKGEAFTEMIERVE